jgi:hypothetical protein
MAASWILALGDGLWSPTGRGTAPWHRKGHGYRGRHQGAAAHQASFREAVLSAYGSRCVSHLPAPRLPDVAHIIMDAEEQLGQPIVSHGLPLTSCLRSQRLCRRCDIPRLRGRRLTGCAIAETERADADPEAARFDRPSPPGRRFNRLQRAARDQLSSSIERRWSAGLPFRSVQVPEMLDQAISCEGVCEICDVVTKWGRRQIESRIRTVPLGRLVIPG